MRCSVEATALRHLCSPSLVLAMGDDSHAQPRQPASLTLILMQDVHARTARQTLSPRVVLVSPAKRAVGQCLIRLSAPALHGHCPRESGAAASALSLPADLTHIHPPPALDHDSHSYCTAHAMHALSPLRQSASLGRRLPCRAYSPTGKAAHASAGRS